MKLGKRSTLRAGFTVVIALLIFSSFEAYRIQDALSERHLDIYRHYVQQDQSLSEIRRSLWLAGNYVRDFFISTTPEQAVALKRQISQLQLDSDAAVRDLSRLDGAGGPEPQLRADLRAFWKLLEPLPDTMLNVSNARQYEYLQKEIVPRRDALYTGLRNQTADNQAFLQAREREFAATRRASARHLLLTLGLCVLLGILVATFSLRYGENLERDRQHQYEEMRQTKRELEQLSARLLDIEEEGRKRLSRELHDEIVQGLAVLQIEISGAESMTREPALVERLARVRDMAERTLQTVRHISLLLRPSLLDDLGLVPALQFQLEEFLRRNNIACEFHEEGVKDRLPESVKTCAFRVIQETLHNCEKHAHARRVKVTLRQTPEWLLAEVEDDGCGFQINAKGMPVQHSGLGILGMRERVAVAGGSMVLDSAPGRGTRVALKLPVPSDALTADTEPVRKEATA